MRDTLSDYGDRYRSFFEEIRRDLDEYNSDGFISRPAELSRQTGQHLSHNDPPQYFVGDLDASIVLVHLNPKDQLPSFAGPDPFASLDAYFDAHRYFGERMYGPDSPRAHRSPFDAKQIRFLREFGVMDFVDEKTPEDRFTNLQRVIDDKLQLELVPYNSQTFNVRGFTPEVLQPHLNRIMKVIAASPRKFVFFCGAVFDRVLAGSVTHEHTFHLLKNNGEREKRRTRFSNLAIQNDGEIIHAALCSSWALQGIPMSSYGYEVAQRY